MRENNIKEPIIFIVIDPNTKVNYMDIYKALRSIYEKEPNFIVYSKEKTKHIIIAGVEEETLQIVVEALRKEFNIEFKVSNTQIIYKQTIKNNIKSEGRYIKQCGGDCYGHCWIEVEPNERGRGYEFVNKIYDDEVIPRKFIESINSGIQEAIKLGICCGYSLTDIKATLYDGSYHKFDSRQMAYMIAGSMAIIKATKDIDFIFLEPILKLVIKSKDNKEDIIRLIHNSSGKIEDGIRNGEITVYIPLRETIGNASLDLKNLVKHALSIDISHYEELPYEIQNNVVNEVDLYRCEYMDLLNFKTEEEEIL
jgi:elongation factor G